MSTYTVVQARSRLSELIKRAQRGEGVVITRRGEPTVELKVVAKPAKKPEKPKSKWTKEEALEWLRALRTQLTPAKTDAVTLVRQMREEGEE